MALDGTFSGLKASVADFLNRADLTAAIPDFVTLAEAQMARRFAGRLADGKSYPRRLVTTGDLDYLTDAASASVPSDCLGLLELVLTGADGSIIQLEYIDNANFQRERQLARFTGAPKFCTVVGTSVLIYPAADQDYDGDATYLRRWPALTDGNQAANWILQDYPDAYLYGALTAAEPYLNNDARLATWGNLFSGAIEDICNADPMPTNKTTLRVDDLPCGLSGRYRPGTYTGL